jgi:hypothetical protein
MNDDLLRVGYQKHSLAGKVAYQNMTAIIPCAYFSFPSLETRALYTATWFSKYHVAVGEGADATFLRVKPD